MTSKLIDTAKLTLQSEIDGIKSVIQNLDCNFEHAIELIRSCSGKLILTGIGKSGHVAKKIAATFSSTGTPSLFLHPAEALHGDLGIVSSGDLVIAISYSGESPELMSILRYSKRKSIPLISITGNPNSTLSRHSNVNLNVKIDSEACPLGLAPTTSSTATLALGDALAMVTLEAKGISSKNFAEWHPSGSLGAKLLTKVKDIMHTGSSLPLVNEDTPISEVLSVMTKREVKGATGVINSKELLIGVITDGDIRRFFEESPKFENIQAKDIMSHNPLCIGEGEMAEVALRIMESKRVQMLFVTEDSKENRPKPIGVLGIQDLLKAKIK